MTILVHANQTLGHTVPAQRLAHILDDIGLDAEVCRDVPNDYDDAKYTGLIDCGNHRSELTKQAIMHFARQGKYILHVQNPVLYQSERMLSLQANKILSVFDLSDYFIIANKCVQIGHLLDDEPRTYTPRQRLKKVLYLGTGQPQSLINHEVYGVLEQHPDLDVTFCHRSLLPRPSTEHITVIKTLDNAYDKLADYDLVIAGAGSGVVNECLHKKQVAIVLAPTGAEYQAKLCNYFAEHGGLVARPSEELHDLLTILKAKGALLGQSEQMRDGNQVTQAQNKLSDLFATIQG